MKKAFSEQMARRTFEYGNHQILITVTAEHENKKSYSVDYGSGSKGYYRTVCVYAYPSDVDIEDAPFPEDESVQFDVKEETICRIRREEKTPNFEVPDDPDISLFKRVSAYFSDKTIEELKEEKRAKKEANWERKFEPSGPAVPLDRQLEDTVRPVLEELDMQYQIVGADVQVDIDVTIEKMEAEVSWAEVDTELERITDTVPSGE